MTAAAPTERVLITGHAGFTGRHLIAHLLTQPELTAVVGLDRRTCEEMVGLEQIVGDLLDPATIARAIQHAHPRHIIHLAGAFPPAAVSELWAANVGIAMNLLDSVCRLDSPRPRILIVGSAAEYGPSKSLQINEQHPCRPITTYGLSKLAQTRLALDYARCCGVDVCVARPFNLMGPGMSASFVAGTICAQLARSSAGPLHLGNLDSGRDYVDVRDAVAAYWQLAQDGASGEIYNVCSGSVVSGRELLARALTLADRASDVCEDPSRIRGGDVDYSCGDPTKARTLTGWIPRRSFDETLGETLAWFRSRAGDD